MPTFILYMMYKQDFTFHLYANKIGVNPYLLLQANEESSLKEIYIYEGKKGTWKRK